MSALAVAALVLSLTNGADRIQADCDLPERDWRGYDRIEMDVAYRGETFKDSLSVVLFDRREPFYDHAYAMGRSLRLYDGMDEHWVLKLENFPAAHDFKSLGSLRFNVWKPDRGEVAVSNVRLVRPGEKAEPAVRRPEARAKWERERQARERAVAQCAFAAFERAAKAAGQKGNLIIGTFGSETKARPFGPEVPQAVSLREGVSLSLAGYEKEALQIVVGAKTDQKSVRVSCGDLRCGDNVLPARTVRCCVLGYVKTKDVPLYPIGRDERAAEPGWWPDPILEYLDATEVRRGVRQSFWIRVSAPDNQPPEEYCGELCVTADADCVKIPFRVRVYGFALPHSAPLRMAVTFEPKVAKEYQGADGLRQGERLTADPLGPITLWKRHRMAWARMLADHYVNFDSIYHRSTGAATEEFPAVGIQRMLASEGRGGGINLGYWSYPKSLTDEGKSAWRASTLDRLRACHARVKAAGLEDRAYLYGCDEVPREFFANVEWAVTELKREFPGVRLLTTAYDHDFGVGTPLAKMDDFVPLTTKYDREKARKGRALGHRVWWYVCRYPYRPYANMFIESPGIEARLLMGAMTAKERPDGFLYYQTSLWRSPRPIDGTSAFTDWEPQSWCTYHGDGSWTCCGPDGTPLPTQRLENFRDGVEDYAYVVELERRLKEHPRSPLAGEARRLVAVPDEIVKSMRDYTDSPKRLRDWRNRMGELIERLVAEDRWRLLPIYGGGCVTGVEFTSDPNVLYSYVDVGGPYRSDDGGRSWRPLHGNMSLGLRNHQMDQIKCLSVDPRNPESFVAVGGSDYATGGAIVSRDGGRTFRKTLVANFYGNGPRREGRVLARDPFCPDRLVAGGDGSGLLLSEDNGETWSCVSQTNMWFDDVRFDTAAHGVAYACGHADAARGHVEGVLLSENGGKSWRRVSQTAPYEMMQLSAGGPLIGIFEGHRKVRLSKDRGRTWTDWSEGLFASPRKEQLRAWDAGHYRALAADGDAFIVGDVLGNISRRRLADAAWRKVESKGRGWGTDCEEWEKGITSQLSMGSVTVDPHRAGHWFTTDWYDVWETTDAGEHWTTRVNGMQQLVPFTIGCDPYDENTICYGVADVGIFVSKDGGKSYRPPRVSFGVNSFAFSKRSPGLSYLTGGKFATCFLRSSDHCTTWQAPALKGLPSPLKAKGYMAMTVAVNPVDDTVWTCVSGPVGKGAGGVYRSSDRGESWTWDSDGLPPGERLFKDCEFGGGQSPQLEFHNDGSVAYLRAPMNNSLYRREGGLWVKCVLPDTRRVDVTADPFVPGKVFIGGRPGLVTKDGGRTFERLPGFAEWDSPCAFSCDPHRRGTVVCGIWDALMLSRDGGQTWTRTDEGLHLPTGNSRRTVIDRGRLFYLTTGSGVWIRTIPE